MASTPRASPRAASVLLLLLPLLVVVVAIPRPASALRLFRSFESPLGGGAAAAPGSTTLGRLDDHASCDAPEMEMPPTDRANVHPAASALAAAGRSVRAAAARAREGLHALTTTRDGADADTEGEKKDAASATTTTPRDAFADVVESLAEIERELFLASSGPRGASSSVHVGPLETGLRALRDGARRWPWSGGGGGDALASSSSSSSSSSSPFELLRSAMDVRETDAALTFTADVPGVKLEDLSVEVDERDRVLIVRGKREETTEEDVETPTTPKKKKEEIEIKKAEETAPAPHQRTYHRRERHFGSFENRYALPFNAELDAIDAKVDHGVLKITVPKRRPKEGEAEVRSIHWFPYDRVGEVNADP